MTLAHVVESAARLEAAECVLANRLRASRGARCRRRPRCEPGSSRRAPRGRRGTSTAPGASARAVVERRARRRTRRACRAALLALGQAAVAPVDRRSERSLPLGEVDRALHLERQPLLERADDLRRGKHDQARGDELDGERKPVEPSADLVYRRERIRPEHDATSGGELDEERGRVLDRERLERQDVLGREAERRATRRSTCRSGARSSRAAT